MREGFLVVFTVVGLIAAGYYLQPLGSKDKAAEDDCKATADGYSTGTPRQSINPEDNPTDAQAVVDGQPKPSAGDQARNPPEPFQGKAEAVLEKIRKGMTKKELWQTIDEQDVLALPITISIHDTRTHLNFRGFGPVTFEFDREGRLVRWEPWKKNGMGESEQSAEFSTGPIKGRVNARYVER